MICAIRAAESQGQGEIFEDVSAMLRAMYLDKKLRLLFVVTRLQISHLFY
jgi:hypothetical protein